MDYHLILAGASLIFVLASFILMHVSNRKFTEGYFKSYMDVVVLSGTFMSIYLLASLVSKLELAHLSPYREIIKIAAYTIIGIASLLLIKSSILLDKMSKKYSFKEKKFFKQFN